MKWTTKPLSEVADFCLGKMLDDKKNKGDPLPYLANINVRWGEFDLENLREMRFEHDEMDRYGLKYGDIVMCEGGEPGRCAIWKEAMPGMLIQKALHRIRPHDCLDHRFLFYVFLHKGMNGSFATLFTGATIKHLPRQNLAKVEISFPWLELQRRIADVLSTYDDLIENNRRRIQLLEESARLLYKEWFIRLRFPGHEHVKIVDGVPEGWEQLRFENVCDSIGGGTPSTAVPYYWDGDITWVTPSDVTNLNSIYLVDSDKKITESGLRNSSAKMLPENAILMTSRASIGFFAIANRPICTNQGFISVIPIHPYSREFLLFHLISRVEEFRSRASGSTFKELSKGKFRELKIIFPSELILQEFSNLVSDTLEQIKTLTTMNIKLSQVRDLLLPRLMNGEITV